MLIDKIQSQYEIYQERKQEREEYHESVKEELSPSEQEEYENRRTTTVNLYLIGILSGLLSIGVFVSGILALVGVSAFVILGELVFSASPVSTQLTSLVIVISPILGLICSQFVLNIAMYQSENVRQIEQKIRLEEQKESMFETIDEFDSVDYITSHIGVESYEMMVVVESNGIKYTIDEELTVTHDDEVVIKSVNDIKVILEMINTHSTTLNE